MLNTVITAFLSFFGSKPNVTISLKQLFLDKPALSVYEPFSRATYIISPYKDVKIRYDKGSYTLDYARYNNTFLVNNTHTLMLFSNPWPENFYNDDDCYYSGVSSNFYLNIICDPLTRWSHDNVLALNPCAYNLSFFTDVGCDYFYSDRREL